MPSCLFFSFDASWTLVGHRVAPPGFYKPAGAFSSLREAGMDAEAVGGWDEGKTAQDFEDADDERE
jgi:hypothetical protein